MSSCRTFPLLRLRPRSALAIAAAVLFVIGATACGGADGPSGPAPRNFAGKWRYRVSVYGNASYFEQVRGTVTFQQAAGAASVAGKFVGERMDEWGVWQPAWATLTGQAETTGRLSFDFRFDSIRGTLPTGWNVVRPHVGYPAGDSLVGSWQNGPESSSGWPFSMAPLAPVAR